MWTQFSLVPNWTLSSALFQALEVTGPVRSALTSPSSLLSRHALVVSVGP